MDECARNFTTGVRTLPPVVPDAWLERTLRGSFDLSGHLPYGEQHGFAAQLPHDQRVKHGHDQARLAQGASESVE